MAKGQTENTSRTAESIHKQHGKISMQTAHLTSPECSITINLQDKIVGQDNDHLHLTDSHFSQDDQECDNPSSFSHDTIETVFHSPTRSPASISPLGDQMSDVTTRADDRWARLTLLLWVTTRGGVARASQVWQDGRYDRTFDVLAPYLSTTEGSESISQVGKLHEMPAKTLDREARLQEGGEDPTRDKLWRRRKWPEGWKSRRTELSDLPQDGLGHEPGSNSRTDERSVEKRSTEQARVRSLDQHHEPPR